MTKCTFCGEDIEPGRGIIYVERSGKVINFCSGKCKKNYALGRDGTKLKWTKLN